MRYVEGVLWLALAALLFLCCDVASAGNRLGKNQQHENTVYTDTVRQTVTYEEQSTAPPTPASGKIVFYFDSSGTAKTKDDTGTVNDVGAGSSSGSGGALPDTRGLTLTSNPSNPTYQVDVSADWILAVSSDASASQITTGFADTWDLTADLDTGSEGSSRWYYGWLVYESSTWTPYFSESASVVSGVASTAPRIRLFSIYNDGSSNLRLMAGAGTNRWYLMAPNTSLGQVYSGTVTADHTAYTTLDLSGYIPPHCSYVRILWSNATNSNTLLFEQRELSENYARINDTTISRQNPQRMRFAADTRLDHQYDDVLIYINSKIFVRCNSASNTFYIAVGNFWEEYR